MSHVTCHVMLDKSHDLSCDLPLQLLVSSFCLFVCCRARSMNQKNFQLIIITHDEAFVELLGHTGYADCFYKVTKEFG